MTAKTAPVTSPRVGRRRGPTSTRDGVLAAARARFASDGFAATTIRRVATDAGVDPSQVMQFFGSKDDLFAAVMAIPATALARFDTAFEGPSEHLGERVVRAYLEAWDAEASESEPLMAMLRGAVVNEAAAAALREFIQSRLSHGMAGRSGDALLRAGLAASMLIGIIVSRRIVGVPALVAADTDRLVAAVGPALQVLLVAPTGWRRSA
ncbi:TetR/AcrR family transcriptional regulator [Frondihabitans cladoniiphilus]|uniref:TetR family transcriptional regulator n=1 Tax=Frondihabitans cladoniiphilus TaxID=715785 RepID=A0ABP8VP09_9MICO